MTDTQEDVKTDSTSSPESSQQDAGQQTQADSSPATTQTEGAKAKTPEDIVKAVLQKSTSQTDKSGEQQTTDKTKDGTQTGAKDKGEEKGPIPYDRFSEVNQAKVKAEQTIQAQQGLVDAQSSIINFCSSNNITSEEFTEWMNIAAAVKTNPEQALKLLQPHLGLLQGYTGEKLPEDLQKAVDNGELSLAHAKRLVAAETRSKFGQQQQQMTQEQMRSLQQQQLARSYESSMVSWINSKKGIDPDFAPKASPTDPDGKYELFLHRFAVDSRSSRVNSIEDLLRVAEQSLSAVDGAVARFRPKSNGSPHIKSTQSVTAPQSKPKTVGEAVSAVAAKHGIHFDPTTIK